VDVKFPLFAFEKDDRSSDLVESPSAFSTILEAIDIETANICFGNCTGKAYVCQLYTAADWDRQVAFGDQAMTLPQHLRLTLRLINCKGLRDNLPSILGESLQSNFRQEKRFVEVVRGDWKELDCITPVTRLTGHLKHEFLR